MNIPWNKLFKLTPEATWVFVGQAGTAAAGLFGIKLLTHVLNPDEFGRLALANTIVALVGTNIFGPLGAGVKRFWPISKDRGNLDVFYSVSNRYARYAIYIVLSLSVISTPFLLLKGVKWAVLVALSLIVGAVTGWLGLRISVFTAARKRKQIALLNIGNAFLRPVIAVGLIVLIAADASWAMIGYLSASFLILLVAERLYRHAVSETASSTTEPDKAGFSSKSLGKEILLFSWPFLVWGIFGWVYMSSDRWALQTFYGAEVVGAFAVVSQLAVYPLIFGSTFLSTLFTPIAFQRVGDFTNRHNIISANKMLGVMTGVYILGSVILISLFFLFHHSLVLLISNTQYAKFSFLLPWLTVAWGLFYLGQVLSTFGMLANNSKIYIMPKLVSAVVAGVGTFYLASKIGPVGIVWGLATAGFVYALWCTIIAWKVVGGGLQKEGLINTT